MYGKLPGPIMSNFGYQGCLANLELGAESVDPISAALVPNSGVVSGCDGKIQFSYQAVPGLLCT